jgi:hypothetical protein
MPQQAFTTENRAMLALAASALFDAPLALPQNVDFAALLAAVRAQALDGVLCDGLSSLPEDAVPLDVMQVWQSRAVALMRKSATLQAAQAALLATCRRLEIPAVILKGFSAAVCYPAPDLRAAGDIDCLVPPARLDALCHALEVDGFVREEGLDEHHVAYCKNGVELEIHFKISGLPTGAIGDLLQSEVFDSIFARAEEAELYGERFPVPCPYHQALILLLHIAKHLRDGGVGLRQVLDFALFVKMHHTVLDFDFLQLLSRIGLYRFTALLLLGCTRHLGLPAALVPWCLDADAEMADALFSDFLTGGNFGRAEESYAGSGMAHKGRKKGERAFSAALRGVADMCRLEWPACRKFPPLLLLLVPFWILRRLLDRSKPRVRPVRMIKNAQKRAEFYDSIGFFDPEEPPPSIDKSLH